jgi:hypothetical protein
LSWDGYIYIFRSVSSQTNISHTIIDKHKQAIHLLEQAARVYDYRGGYSTRHKAAGTETSTIDLGVFFFGLGTVI